MPQGLRAGDGFFAGIHNGVGPATAFGEIDDGSGLTDVRCGGGAFTPLEERASIGSTELRGSSSSACFIGGMDVGDNVSAARARPARKAVLSIPAAETATAFVVPDGVSANAEVARARATSRPATITTRSDNRPFIAATPAPAVEVERRGESKRKARFHAAQRSSGIGRANEESPDTIDGGLR